MTERAGIEGRYRWALVAGLAAVIGLQAALFAPGGDEEAADERSAAQLVSLPETDAPLADIGEALVPDRANEPAPRAADVPTRAQIPSVPLLTEAATAQPIMFLERLDEPEAEENPAVTYASASDFLVSSESGPQALRPIDDRPVEVLATVGARRRGIGADGPHCVPGRPMMLSRSPVASGAAFTIPRL